MEYYKLPAYNKARELTEQITRSTQKVPRDIRFSYVTQMQTASMGIMEHIAFANENPEERAAYLDKAIMDLQRIMIRVRILKDLKYLPLKGYSAIIRKEEELVKQLTGWLNKTTESNNKH